MIDHAEDRARARSLSSVLGIPLSGLKYSSPILMGPSPGLLRIEKDLSHILIWKNNLYRYAVLLAAHDVVP